MYGIREEDPFTEIENEMNARQDEYDYTALLYRVGDYERRVREALGRQTCEAYQQQNIRELGKALEQLNAKKFPNGISISKQVESCGPQNVLRSLGNDAAERKARPIATGLLDYFPLACAEVARLSKIANEQHNPGQPMHWARGKSADHADTIVRHLIERGSIDTDGIRHSAKVAWRALALLQTELEEAAGWKPEEGR